MKSIYLISPGEVLEEAHYIKDMGYEIDLYPTTQDTSELTDSRYAESAAYIGRAPETTERAHVRSLRASFIRMLRDNRYSNNDTLIFSESDSIPCIKAEALQPIVDELLDKHPEADVIRLFDYACFSNSIPEQKVEDSPAFYPMVKSPQCDANSAKVWGTHALIIPCRSREKVANIFADYRLPTDIALEAAHGKGEICVMSCSANLFVQKRRVEQSQPYKIAVILSSYKRFNELQRQIWCMMDQDYPHLYHLFVAVKGMSENTFRKHLYPQFEHFIKEGKLTLRYFPNKNQLSNILDTVREIDVSAYDLFVKIDDDDIYKHNYLSTINSYHEHLPRGMGSYHSGYGSYLRNVGGFPHFVRDVYHSYGPTLVFPPEVLKSLFQYENNPSPFSNIVLNAPWHPELREYGFAEDAVIDRINDHEHCCNRGNFIDKMGHTDSISFSQIHSSVTRGSYISGDFWDKNYSISTNPENNEVVIEVQHPFWNGLIRILANRAIHLGTNDEGDVLEYSENSLKLKWDNAGYEYFIRTPEGYYQLAPNTPQ